MHNRDAVLVSLASLSRHGVGVRGHNQLGVFGYSLTDRQPNGLRTGFPYLAWSIHLTREDDHVPGRQLEPLGICGRLLSDDTGHVLSQA